MLPTLPLPIDHHHPARIPLRQRMLGDKLLRVIILKQLKIHNHLARYVVAGYSRFPFEINRLTWYVVAGVVENGKFFWPLRKSKRKKGVLYQIPLIERSAGFGR